MTHNAGGAMVLAISSPANAAYARAGPPARKAAHDHRPLNRSHPPRAARSPAPLAGIRPPSLPRAHAPPEGMPRGMPSGGLARKDRIHDD